MRIIYTPKNIFKRNSRFSPLSKNISRFAVEYIHFELDIFFAYKANYLTEASEYTQKITLFYSFLKIYPEIYPNTLLYWIYILYLQRDKIDNV